MKSQEVHQCIFGGSARVLRKGTKEAWFRGREVYKGNKTEIKSSSLFITKSYYLENLLSDFLNL